MELAHEKPPTLLSHGELPYPRGTFVVDDRTGRKGELQGVIEERTKNGDRLIGRTAYMRPRGGGVEWEVPLNRIRLADDDG
ncbi:hypothetical protein ACWEGQ_13185 [Streptomyces seoulensis]